MSTLPEIYLMKYLSSPHKTLINHTKILIERIKNESFNIGSDI